MKTDLKGFFVYANIQLHPSLVDCNYATNKMNLKIIKEKLILEFIKETFEQEISQSLNIKTVQIKNQIQQTLVQNDSWFETRNNAQEIQQQKTSVFSQRVDPQSQSLRIMSHLQRRDFTQRISQQNLDECCHQQNNKQQLQEKNEPQLVEQESLQSQIKIFKPKEMSTNRPEAISLNTNSSANNEIKQTQLKNQSLIFVGYLSNQIGFVQIDQELYEFILLDIVSNYIQYWLEYQKGIIQNFIQIQNIQIDLGNDYLEQLVNQIQIKHYQNSEQNFGQSLKSFQQQYSQLQLQYNTIQELTGYQQYTNQYFLLLKFLQIIKKTQCTEKEMEFKVNMFQYLNLIEKEENREILDQFFHLIFQEMKTGIFKYNFFVQNKESLNKILNIQQIYKIFERC